MVRMDRDDMAALRDAAAELASFGQTREANPMSVHTHEPCPECGAYALRISYRATLPTRGRYGKARVQWQCEQCGKRGPVQFVIPDEAPLTGR